MPSVLEELQGNQCGWSVIRQGCMVGGKMKVVRPNHIGFISHLKDFCLSLCEKGKQLAGEEECTILSCGKYIWGMSEGRKDKNRGH